MKRTKPQIALQVDPKRLLELLRIARHGSYTKAAQTLGVSQPALSNSIAALERTLAVRLLERSRRGAVLTEHGRILTGYAEALEVLLIRAARELELKTSGLEGSLSIGVSPVACVELVPEAVVRLRQQAPQVSVSIHEEPDDRLLQRLQAGEIDVMVSPAGLQSDPPDVLREVLLRDRFVLIASPRGRYGRRRSMTLSELHDAQWVMPNAQTAMWRHIEALFIAENLVWPAHSISTGSITALKALVMRTDAVSISSPRLMKPEFDAGMLSCITLRRPNLTREIGYRIWRGVAAKPLTHRFIESLRSVAREMPK